MGDVVTDFNNAPQGLITFEIPVNDYAVFSIRSKFGFLWGIVIGKIKKYIFNEWLPCSKTKWIAAFWANLNTTTPIESAKTPQ
jgi:predicted transcriptional regulator YdeE